MPLRPLAAPTGTAWRAAVWTSAVATAAACTALVATSLTAFLAAVPAELPALGRGVHRHGCCHELDILHLRSRQLNQRRHGPQQRPIRSR